MNTVAHIVNPFVADMSSDLFVAQPITFQSMLQAKARAKDRIKVDLLSAQFNEDLSIVPEGFQTTKSLERSVLALGFFEKPIKLPLLTDILHRLYTESDAEFLIYTNVDIGLYPDFYLRVDEFINLGYDAFIINRRRIPSKFTSPSELDLIYKEHSKKHPGFDCFVFHRSIFPKLKLEGICIGVPFIEISFSQNLFALSKNFKLFEEEHQTFHLGMEVFKKRAPKEYFEYNKKQFWKLIPELKEDLDLKKFPFSGYFWPFRIIKWGLHPCIPIRLVLKLEAKRLKKLLGMIGRP